jgi:hypothetical protein
MRLFIADCCALTAIGMTIAFCLGIAGQQVNKLDPQTKRVAAIYKLNREYVKDHPWLSRRLRENEK